MICIRWPMSTAILLPSDWLRRSDRNLHKHLLAWIGMANPRDLFDLRKMPMAECLASLLSDSERYLSLKIQDLFATSQRRGNSARLGLVAYVRRAEGACLR
jgi:hypothetical protein